MYRTLLGLGAALCLTLLAPLSSGEQDPTQDQTPGRTVVLVRHAETAEPTGGGADPALSDAGKTRAAALARLLGHAGVTHLFASEYGRTQQTLAPLSEAAELAVTEIAAGEAEAQLAALGSLPPGAVAVVAGHSNTVPGLAAGLGCAIEGLEEHPRYGPMLGHDEYDRLFVVHLPAAGANAAPGVIELRYGSAE